MVLAEIPVIGSTIGGIIVSLIALTVSLPVAIATAAFYIAYRQAEDYFLVPKITGRAVEVPAVVTMLATLIGGALLGIIGALIAIPVAIRLLSTKSPSPDWTQLTHSGTAGRLLLAIGINVPDLGWAH